MTGAFFAAIAPTDVPSDQEVLEALGILQIDPEHQTCAYCGDTSTEWEHLRPLIEGRKPTGYITEIGNLVPSCGKCNQSKGNQNWREWMTGSARKSPASRGGVDLDARVVRLSAYEAWRKPRRVDYEVLVGRELWDKHRHNWDDVLKKLQDSQALLLEIRAIVQSKYEDASPGLITTVALDAQPE